MHRKNGFHILWNMKAVFIIFAEETTKTAADTKKLPYRRGSNNRPLDRS